MVSKVDHTVDFSKKIQRLYVDFSKRNPATVVRFIVKSRLPTSMLDSHGTSYNIYY
jgi:hypothetical protein